MEGRGKIAIIEFNPFYKSAGSGLFNWKDDRELFLNGPLEFRVREGKDPKELFYLHASWVRAFKEYKGEKIEEKNPKKTKDGKKKTNCIIL